MSLREEGTFVYLEVLTFLDQKLCVCLEVPFAIHEISIYWNVSSDLIIVMI